MTVAKLLYGCWNWSLIKQHERAIKDSGEGRECLWSIAGYALYGRKTNE
jgi:hypothetical protein